MPVSVLVSSLPLALSNWTGKEKEQEEEEEDGQSFDERMLQCGGEAEGAAVGAAVGGEEREGREVGAETEAKEGDGWKLNDKLWVEGVNEAGWFQRGSVRSLSDFFRSFLFPPPALILSRVQFSVWQRRWRVSTSVATGNSSLPIRSGSVCEILDKGDGQLLELKIL